MEVNGSTASSVIGSGILPFQNHTNTVDTKGHNHTSFYWHITSAILKEYPSEEGFF